MIYFNEWEKIGQGLSVSVKNAARDLGHGGLIDQTDSALVNARRMVELQRLQAPSVKGVAFYSVGLAVAMLRVSVRETATVKAARHILQKKDTFSYMTKKILHAVMARCLNTGLLCRNILAGNLNGMRRSTTSITTRRITELRIFSFAQADTAEVPLQSVAIVVQPMSFLHRYKLINSGG